MLHPVIDHVISGQRHQCMLQKQVQPSRVSADECKIQVMLLCCIAVDTCSLAILQAEVCLRSVKHVCSCCHIYTKHELTSYIILWFSHRL